MNSNGTPNYEAFFVILRKRNKWTRNVVKINIFDKKLINTIMSQSKQKGNQISVRLAFRDEKTEKYFYFVLALAVKIKRNVT